MEQGHATFRPGSVRHAGSTVTSGLRYVIGGFIAVADRVEHVRRLNERGNRLLLDPEVDQSGLQRAHQLFDWSLALNHKCSLCHQNAADALLRLGRAEAAEVSLRAQIALLPRDSDARFSLGVSLKEQGRHARVGTSGGEGVAEVLWGRGEEICRKGGGRCREGC